MVKILITDNPQAQEKVSAFKPRIIVSRADITDKDTFYNDDTEYNVADVTDVMLDGTDTNILLRFPNAIRVYLPQSLDFSADLDTIGKALLGTKLFAGPGRTPFNIEDDFIMGGDLSQDAPSPDSNDDDTPVEIPINEQIAILNPLLEGKRIGAGTIAELTEQLVELCRKHDLFVRDKITGLFRSRFMRRPLVPEAQAEMVFNTHFIDKLAIQTVNYKTDKNTGETLRSTSFKPIRPNELKLLWQNISYYSTFNSRKEFYDSIPKWDGTPRIETFMKKYFDCDANPHFFLLLITAIIGKIHNPEKNYCPYFFDLVSRSKGIGKTLLWRRLLGGKYVGDIKMNPSRGLSDFLVDAYDGNNVIVLDDECTWCGTKAGQISYDQFKNLVTVQSDKFSRKHRDPEEHTRSFIIVRTSNEVNQVYSPNERRQIIFKSNLDNMECRILNLPPEFWQQILAEGKDFYEKFGMYVLTAEDEKDIINANHANFNYESQDVFTIVDYIKAVRHEPDKYGADPSNVKLKGRMWGSYKKYCQYCEETRKKALVSRMFWRNVEAICALPEMCAEVISDNKVELTDGGRARIFAINKMRPTPQEQEIADMEDMPY